MDFDRKIQLDSALKDQIYKHDRYRWTLDHRTIKGKPWSFEGRNYLKDIYRDYSRDLIFVKGRQVEASELSINFSLQFLTTNHHTKTLYTFPTGELAGLFSGERFKDAIEDSPALANMMAERDSVTVREFINGSYLYLKSAGRGGDKARSISADQLICDEYQDFDQGNLSDTYARDVLMENISHSQFKKTITLGTPKLVGSHFEELWRSSTMNYWHVSCLNCGHEQVLNMENIINFDKAYQEDSPDLAHFGCQRCRKPIDRNIGRWKSLKVVDNVEMSGYHLSRLMTPWQKAKDIVIAHGTKNIKGKTAKTFNNEVLGNFFSGSDVPFNERIVMECCDTDESLLDSSNEATFMGVDHGNITTVTIIKYDFLREQAKVVFHGKFGQSDLLEQTRLIGDLVPRYQVQYSCLDAGYGKIQNAELAKRFPGRVWSCFYTAGRSTLDAIEWRARDFTVLADRSVLFGHMVDRFEKGCQDAGGIVLPYCNRSKPDIKELMAELRNVIAVDSNNRTTYERIGPDHGAHSLLYALIAAERGRGKITSSRHSRSTSGVRMSRRR